jgi:hypothetical protein
MRRFVPSRSSLVFAVTLGALLLPQAPQGAVSVLNLGDLSPSTPTSQFEVSSAALAPSVADAICPPEPRETGDAQVFVSWRDSVQRIMSCAVSRLGTPDCDAVTTTTLDLPTGCAPSSYVADSNDNVMVRLRDGRVLQMFQTIKLRCPPSPGDPFCGAGGPDRDQVAQVIRISDNCGQTWVRSILDADQMRDLEGNLLSPLRMNFDRVDGYADPWSDHVLMTAITGTNPCCCANETLFLAASTVGTATVLDWRRLFTIPGNDTLPTVMTSLPRGAGSRVYWFNCDDYHPTLYWSDDPWDQAGNPLPNQSRLDLLLSEREGPANFDCALLHPSPLRNFIFALGAGRLYTDSNTDRVRVAYNQVISAGGADYQTLRVVDVTVTDDGAGGYLVIPATSRVIDAASNPGPHGPAHVFLPSIIQSDRSTRFDPHASTQVLRWTEVGVQDAMGVGTNVEKLSVWDPTNGWQPDLELGDWLCTGDCSPGDYQYGAYIDSLDECTHRFFVPWGEQIPGVGPKTHGAIVTTSVDTAPPTIASMTATPDILWPPDHRLLPVTVTFAASDDCSSAPPLCKIIAVASNEPVNGPGDGNTAPDWEITEGLVVLLRAERAGSASGRVYTITGECVDASQNRTTKTVRVTVPHDRARR